MLKKIVTSEKAPAAIGPYSQGVGINTLILTSGQLPIDSETGNMPSGISAQTEQSLKNVKAVLERGGSDMNMILKTTVFLKDMNDFAEMNKVYESFFSEGNYPARSAVEVARLPKDALVEIEATAIIED